MTLGMKPGDECCRCREESVEKEYEPVRNWADGQSWPQAAESRWIHVSRLLSRWMVGCVAKQAFPRALSDVQVSFGLDDSMTASLAR